MFRFSGYFQIIRIDLSNAYKGGGIKTKVH